VPVVVVVVVTRCLGHEQGGTLVVGGGPVGGGVDVDTGTVVATVVEASSGVVSTWLVDVEGIVVVLLGGGQSVMTTTTPLPLVANTVPSASCHCTWIVEPLYLAPNPIGLGI
jgi:hypothetical protein